MFEGETYLFGLRDVANKSFLSQFFKFRLFSFATGLCINQREKGRVSVVKLWHHATRHRGENRVEQRGGRVRP